MSEDHFAGKNFVETSDRQSENSMSMLPRQALCVYYGSR